MDPTARGARTAGTARTGRAASRGARRPWRPGEPPGRAFKAGCGHPTGLARAHLGMQDPAPQGGPVREQEVAGQPLDFPEEFVPVARGALGPAPQGAETVQHAVEGEGQQVEQRQQVGEAVAAMPETVFEVIWERSHIEERFLVSGAAEGCGEGEEEVSGRAGG